VSLGRRHHIPAITSKGSTGRQALLCRLVVSRTPLGPVHHIRPIKTGAQPQARGWEGDPKSRRARVLRTHLPRLPGLGHHRKGRATHGLSCRLYARHARSCLRHDIRPIKHSSGTSRLARLREALRRRQGGGNATDEQRRNAPERSRRTAGKQCGEDLPAPCPSAPLMRYAQAFGGSVD